MHLREVPGELWLIAGGAAGWIGKNVLLWVQRRRRTDAAAEATLGSAWAQLHTEWMKDINRLRDEMNARDKLCDERMQEMERSLRNDFDEQNLKLRSVIYSLAKKIPLDPKQQVILASIAPEAPAA
jgi:hypothetical protein